MAKVHGWQAKIFKNQINFYFKISEKKNGIYTVSFKLINHVLCPLLLSLADMAKCGTLKKPSVYQKSLEIKKKKYEIRLEKIEIWNSNQESLLKKDK